MSALEIVKIDTFSAKSAILWSIFADQISWDVESLRLSKVGFYWHMDLVD